MNRSRFALTAVALLLAVSAPLTAHAQVAGDGGSTNPQVAQYEEAVLGSLMDNVAMAQALAQACVAGASRPEVLAFCQTAQTAAQQNATSLQGWLGTWYGNTGYTGQLSDEDNALLAQLTANPDQFEALLLDGWIHTNIQGQAIASSYLDRTCADGSKPGKSDDRTGHGCDTNTNDNPTLTGFAESFMSTLTAQNGQLYAWTCAWYGTGCAAAQTSAQPTTQTTGSGSSTSGGSTDPQIAQYEEAVLGSLLDKVAMLQALSQACLAGASRPEVLTLCQSAQTYAQQSATSLQGWLGTWYGNTSYTGQLSDDDNAMLAQLSANPDQFEELLLSDWVSANKQEIGVATTYLGQACADGGKPGRAGDRSNHSGCATDSNPTLGSFAENVISTLTPQTAELQSWACSWYGKSCGS
jgi:uncharacterized protein (DUF305 family)